MTHRTKTTHRSPFLPYDDLEVTLAAFVALLLALHLDPLSSTVCTLQKDFSVLCIQPQWVLYIPPPAQSTLHSTFHSPLWCDPLRGGWVPRERPTWRLLRSAPSGISNIVVAVCRNYLFRSTLNSTFFFLLLAVKKSGCGSYCHYPFSPALMKRMVFLTEQRCWQFPNAVGVR